MYVFFFVEEGEAEGGEDAEVAADEELPDLQDDAEKPMDQDDPSANAENQSETEDPDQKPDEDKGDANVDNAAIDKTDEHKPQAEGDGNAAQAAEDASENRGECAQRSDDVDGKYFPIRIIEVIRGKDREIIVLMFWNCIFSTLDRV